MAKTVLISIRPEWVEKIANEIKTVEVRKTKPYLETPFKCYIYCTNKRPFLVWGDVFRGDWVTEVTRLSGYGRAEADSIWDVFNGHVVGEFTCDNIATYSYDYCPHPEIGMDYDCGDSWWEIDDEDLKSACVRECGNVRLAHFQVGNLRYAETAERIQGAAENEIWICAC